MFKIEKPEYIYLKLVPDTSIRNYNSQSIAKAMHHMGTNITKRIYKLEKKIIYKTPIKCTYIIDIKKDNAEFFLIVPKQYLGLAKEKIREVWNRVTIEEIKNIEPFSNDSMKYELRYKYEDALSLDIDKKSNEPLNQVFNVMEIMNDADRVSLLYNFIPYNQYGWKAKYSETFKKLENGLSVEKDLSTKKMLKMLAFGVNFVLETFIGAFSELFITKKEGNNSIDNLRMMLGIMNNTKDLSTTSKKKRLETIINTQLLCVSSGENKKVNAATVCQGFNSISADNELVYKQIKKNIKVEEYQWPIEKNKMSIIECNNLIQLPGKELLNQFHQIKKIDTLEMQPPTELIQGYIPLGECTYKGAPSNTYMSNDKNLANLGLVLLGPQGAGKSEYIANYCNAVSKAKEGIILIDFIKNCELSEKVKKVVPKERLIEINLDKYEDAQSFGFNEINNIECNSDIEMLEVANMQTQLVINFINSINPDNELSSRMRRSLAAACNVVFIHKGTSLRDVVECCQDHRKRHQYIDMIPESLKEELQDDVYNLCDMDEVGKTKDDKGQIVGTKDSKIEFVMDRINLLMEDIKLKRMFNKSIDNNIDFVKEMNAGKVILIRMPESKFPTKFHKNILTTFYVCKVWLSSQLRGSLYDKPLRNHIIIDEIFQAPTSEYMLVDILPQARKFQAKFIFSAHYLTQIETIKEALKASGASYMLLQGTDKKNFDEMKEDLAPYELEDLLNLKRFHSLNMVKYSKGYAKFITKLPAPLE